MSMNIDWEESDDEETTLIMKEEMLLKLQLWIENASSELEASESSASTSFDIENLVEEIQQLFIKKDPSKQTLYIHDELDKVFAAEEVGHSCDLCQRDLAVEPEQLGAYLRSLQEACVLACGHVYHFKCLRGTTLDLDNLSTNPSCIFCISASN